MSARDAGAAETEATARQPWSVLEQSLFESIYIFEGDEVVAILADGPETRAKADLIVKSLNAHDELIAALRAVVALADETYGHWDRDNDMRVGKILKALAGHLKGYRADIDEIHAALDRAEGRQ